MPELYVKAELWNKLPEETRKEFEEIVNQRFTGKQRVRFVPDSAQPAGGQKDIDPGELACAQNCQASMNQCLAECIARGAGLPKACIYACAEQIADCIRRCYGIPAE